MLCTCMLNEAVPAKRLQIDRTESRNQNHCHHFNFIHCVVCTYVGAPACACACGGQILASASSFIIPILLFEIGSLREPGTTGLVGQQSPRTNLQQLLSSTQVTGVSCHSSGHWGFELRFSCLCAKQLTETSPQIHARDLNTLLSVTDKQEHTEQQRLCQCLHCHSSTRSPHCRCMLL